ncbi:MAG TPA: NADPH-dependent 7-cyano-7-deazaguanine reductase QueF [Woeseiaceae bacterium]|nr:NADPH-dependent 7-cyano-7-deazaguanine reductase QueF [Woeseiaceae bacterium]
MKGTNLLLGREADYPHKYAPEVLCPITRSDSREPLGITTALPFAGVDIWNAWELTWLGDNGHPKVAVVEIRVPAESPNLIESKSLKLYLGSFAMSRFADAAHVEGAIAADLSQSTGAPVEVTLNPDVSVASLDGPCIDGFDIDCDTWEVDAELLDSDERVVVEESLHSHLLRGLCPVTAQPDMGSVEIRYQGPRIDPVSLLRYIASFREHRDFHEACVERMFVDIWKRCAPTTLSVYARYQRRGGVDINPFRTSRRRQVERPPNTRLWRQ